MPVGIWGSSILEQMERRKEPVVTSNNIYDIDILLINKGFTSFAFVLAVAISLLALVCLLVVVPAVVPLVV